MTYKLTHTDLILRLSDNACIPKDKGNSDYQAYLLWLSKGNVPEPVDFPTNEDIISSLTAQIQASLDAFAKTRNYDGILSACTYATSTVPKFSAEGQYCVQARDATWAAGYALMDEVLAGTRPVPSSIADIEADLPALAWPA